MAISLDSEAEAEYEDTWSHVRKRVAQALPGQQAQGMYFQIRSGSDLPIAFMLDVRPLGTVGYYRQVEGMRQQTCPTSCLYIPCLLPASCPACLP